MVGKSFFAYRADSKLIDCRPKEFALRHVGFTFSSIVLFICFFPLALLRLAECHPTRPSMFQATFQ